jgi:hypothetical protein
MKLAHNVQLRVFVKPSDDETKTKNALLSLLPPNLEKEKIKLNRQIATGFNEQKIIIYEVLLCKDRHINQFLEQLKQKLSSEQKELILKQKNRIDQDCNLFIRLDKEKLINNHFWITDSGNCYHLKISLACFPKSKEKAYAVVKEIFK